MEVSRQAVSKWENDLSTPDPAKLIRLADVLDTDVEYLATGKHTVLRRPPEVITVEKIVHKPTEVIVEKPVYIEKPMAASYEDCARINRISRETGVPCFVAYYRRYLPYFQKVRDMVLKGTIGNIINVQLRFAQPPRNLDYNNKNLPWRVQPDIAGGGYFYDLAPHQLDLLQEMFGCILEAEGYKSNRGGLYDVEDTISACFKFESGLPGSGSWCFVAHESAKEDRIEIIGDKGMLSFSVYTYEPIVLHTEKGIESFSPQNPEYVQLPIIQSVIEHLQGKSICTCDGLSATPTNWVMDRILNKL